MGRGSNQSQSVRTTYRHLEMTRRDQEEGKKSKSIDHEPKMVEGARRGFPQCFSSPFAMISWNPLERITGCGRQPRQDHRSMFHGRGAVGTSCVCSREGASHGMLKKRVKTSSWD